MVSWCNEGVTAEATRFLLLLSDCFIAIPLVEPFVQIVDQVADGLFADADKLGRTFSTKTALYSGFLHGVHRKADVLSGLSGGQLLLFDFS